MKIASIDSLPNDQAPTVAISANPAPNRHLNISRRPQLAPELNCFRPGQPLSTIRFIANANSVHVARWLTLLSHTHARVEIETANHVPAYANEFLSSRPLLPGWLKIPMVLRYLLSGLRLRFFHSRRLPGLVHAHCTSGNGFVAWLSGQRYLIGAYGTEIFGAHERGFVYRWMLRKVLQGAERIQVGSTECIKILQEQYQIAPERIYCFHNGLDEQFFHGVDDQSRMQMRRERDLPVDEPIWIVNRRTHPHYRTREIVEGFLGHCQQGGPGRLVLLCGDHQADYTQSICELLQSHAHGNRVTVVQQMLSHLEVAAWLQLSDFSISVPKTDMFSVSTYESLGCGAVLIVANLEAYRPLQPCQAVHWMTQYEPQDFTQVFAKTAATWPTQHRAQRNECLQFAQEGFSSENAIRDIAAFYQGVPLRKDAMAKWAA